MLATVTAHRDYTIANIDDRLYGAFLEHLGRAIYTGIYEPGHPSADEHGMRRDVIDLVRELQVPIVRYPGGNFVSAYDWQDGIGPRETRPTRLDLAWHTSESNAVGVHEFITWCRAAGAEPMLALNLGSRGLDEARKFVEYVNAPAGSYWGDLRGKNGHPEPFNVKHWCLGNEMDGPWQIGHKTADEYGRLANETAKALRAFDSSLQLVVCGSSHSYMPTYPEWERVVLEHTYDVVDYVSLHMYFNNRAQNTAEYLAMNARLDDYITTVASTIRYVRAKKRSTRTVAISFDEWNVWYHSNEQDRPIREGKMGWPHAPRLLEDIYNMEDALQVGCILNTFIRHADIVRIACIAQLVNVIAPIMTEPGGAAWRQTIFYPLYYASRYGRGAALRLAVQAPAYDAAVADNVPYLDIAGVHDADGQTLTFFAVNRHLEEDMQVTINLNGFGQPQLLDQQVLNHADLQAANTLTNPTEVTPAPGSGAQIDAGQVVVSLPAHSYQVLRLKLA